jgi:hypothetical protein
VDSRDIATDGGCFPSVGKSLSSRNLVGEEWVPPGQENGQQECFSHGERSIVQAVPNRAVSDMQTRRDVLGAVTYLAGLTLIASCDSEPKPASTATLFNKEEVHGAIQELDSQIGALEEDAEDFDSENWRDVVPRIKEGAESVRGALETLKKALGYSS